MLLRDCAHSPRQAAALLLLLRMPPAGDVAKAMRWAVKQGSLKVLACLLSFNDCWHIVPRS